jgi:hypothetical protein
LKLTLDTQVDVAVEISDDGDEFVVELAFWDGLVGEERSYEICGEMSRILTAVVATQSGSREK